MLVYIANLALRLEQLGMDVEIISAHHPHGDSSDHIGKGVRLVTSPCHGLLLGINPISFVLPKILASTADVIHAHSYIFLTTNQAAVARHLDGRPTVLHIHGGISSPGNGTDAQTAHLFGLKEGLYDGTLGRWTIDSVDAVAAVSRYDLRQCRDRFHVSERKLHWIPNAVDTSLFHPTPRKPGVTPLITYAGHLERWKGVESFIEVARRVSKNVPEARFRLVGDGSMREALIRGARDLGGNVEFIPTVSHSQMPELMRESTLLLFPSFSEGLPSACLEALASGVPVVASDVGGIPEVVLEGETGYLCGPRDLDRFTERTLGLLADEDLRFRMGIRGAELVRTTYSWENVARLAVALYRQVAG